MKNFIIKFIIVILSFIVFMETISLITKEKHLMSTNVEGFTYHNENNKNDVYFIGDSYAQTVYADEGYPLLFRDYFKERQWNFIDLSVPGSTIKKHKPLLDSLSGLKPKVIIYFYHINNSLQFEKILNDSISKRKINKDGKTFNAKKNKKSWLKQITDNSATILLFKKAIQYFSLEINDTYYPGTPAYKSPIKTLELEDELESYFQSINAENVFILVNTPFAAGSRSKKWEQYEVFKRFEKNNKFQIIQTVDIVDDPDYSLSWRNNHPNQEAIKIIADTLIQRFKKIK